MAEISNGLKSVLLKGMEAISNTASNIATNTKYKIDEMNLLNRRHEIISDFGSKAYQIWQKGEEKFPEELDLLLQELSRIDEAMNTMRAERVAAAPQLTKEEAEEAAAPDAVETEVEETLDDANDSSASEGIEETTEE